MIVFLMQLYEHVDFLYTTYRRQPYLADTQKKSSENLGYANIPGFIMHFLVIIIRKGLNATSCIFMSC